MIACDPLTQYFGKVSRPEDTSILQMKTLKFGKVKRLVSRHEAESEFKLRTQIFQFLV